MLPRLTTTQAIFNRSHHKATMVGQTIAAVFGVCGLVGFVKMFLSALSLSGSAQSVASLPPLVAIGVLGMMGGLACVSIWSYALDQKLRPIIESNDWDSPMLARATSSPVGAWRPATNEEISVLHDEMVASGSIDIQKAWRDWLEQDDAPIRACDLILARNLLATNKSASSPKIPKKQDDIRRRLLADLTQEPTAWDKSEDIIIAPLEANVTKTSPSKNVSHT